uniref:NADH dehydrogenase subunit 4L n=1 Tax=Miroplana shenzhensis TaxID=2597322 RepID=UPI001FAE7A40
SNIFLWEINDIFVFFLVLNLIILMIFNFRLLSFLVSAEIIYLLYFFNMHYFSQFDYGHLMVFLIVVICEAAVSLGLVVFFFSLLSNNNGNINMFFDF